MLTDIYGYTKLFEKGNNCSLFFVLGKKMVLLIEGSSWKWTQELILGAPQREVTVIRVIVESRLSNIHKVLGFQVVCDKVDRVTSDTFLFKLKFEETDISKDGGFLKMKLF